MSATSADRKTEIQNKLITMIKEARSAKGLSQEELAEKANLNDNTIKRIEAGYCLPLFSTVVAIFKGLDVDVPSLICDALAAQGGAPYSNDIYSLIFAAVTSLQERHLSYKDISKLSGVSQIALKKLMAAERAAPYFMTMLRIMAVCDVDIMALIEANLARV